MENIERESMEYDVVVVGAGPAGLSTAIKLKQLANEQSKEMSICVVEKGSEVGAHILSGAVIETKALDELIPDWQAKGAPLNTPVSDEKFMFLSETGQINWPASLLPRFQPSHRQMHSIPPLDALTTASLDTRPLGYLRHLNLKFCRLREPRVSGPRLTNAQRRDSELHV